jgi:hypothetical protein
VTATVESVGLPVYSTAVREPDEDGAESTPQAFLIGRKRLVR